jgi:hypothetical protein
MDAAIGQLILDAPKGVESDGHGKVVLERRAVEK